jgi:hypothetical protein
LDNPLLILNIVSHRFKGFTVVNIKNTIYILNLLTSAAKYIFSLLSGRLYYIADAKKKSNKIVLNEYTIIDENDWNIMN